MAFKYFLFFDFFLGGKMPIDIGKKLYNNLTNNKTIYNGIIRKNEYIMLKKNYIEQNKINSKFFVIFEFKKEIRTKYFSGSFKIRI